LSRKRNQNAFANTDQIATEMTAVSESPPGATGACARIAASEQTA
jgi:hypothetical protein